jgi:hypothetical protein
MTRYSMSQNVGHIAHAERGAHGARRAWGTWRTQNVGHMAHAERGAHGARRTWGTWRTRPRRPLKKGGHQEARLQPARHYNNPVCGP